jgi:hypothetical protein
MKGELSELLKEKETDSLLQSVKGTSRNINDPRLSFLQRQPTTSGQEFKTNSQRKSYFDLSSIKKNIEQSLLSSFSSSSASTSIESTPILPTIVSSSSSSTSTTGNSSLNEGSELSSTSTKREKCHSLFHQRSFLPESQKHLPPLLFTFPGSGNTWCRLLIEYGSGIYTGSVYNDDKLLTALPGEFTCNWQVSAVKAHPHTHRASDLLSGHYLSDNDKCRKGNIQRFERFVLLIRDPFDSIWSEFQRRVSQSHVAGIPKDSFSWHRWQANAMNLAHAYFDMWKLDHEVIERQLPSSSYLYVKYEDLKDKGNRHQALEKIVSFLRLPSTSSMSSKFLMKRLECAFLLADNRQYAHRTIDKSTFMTKDLAYLEEIVCRMWALFGVYASKYGYSPFNGFNCDGYPKAPKVSCSIFSVPSFLFPCRLMLVLMVITIIDGLDLARSCSTFVENCSGMALSLKWILLCRLSLVSEAIIWYRGSNFLNPHLKVSLRYQWEHL